MRLHVGAPKQPLEIAIGRAVFDKNGRELSIRARRLIAGLWGVSWRCVGGFRFVGVQFHAKQDGEP